MATASEIAAYRGNAAAALGSTAGQGATDIYGPTDSSGVMERQDVVRQTNANKNILEWQQRVKDRDALYGQIAATRNSEKNPGLMLDKDRQHLDTEYSDKMMDMMIANPDLKNNPQEYLKFQKMSEGFETGRVYAQARYKAITGMDAEIAKEVDPEKRARMQAHRDKMAAQGLYEEIKPYQQLLDWTEETFVKPKVDEIPLGEKADGDYIISSKRKRTALDQFITGVNYNYVDSPNRSLANQMDAYVKSFQSMNDDMKASQLKLWNDKIAEVNKLEGIAGTPKEIKPIRFQVVQDPQGNKHVVVNDSVPNIILAESLLKNYKNETESTPKLSDMAAKIRRQNAASLKDTATATQLIPSQVQKNMAERAKAISEKKKADEETKGIKQKNVGKQMTGDWYINTVASAFDEERFAGMPYVSVDNYTGDAKNKYKGIPGILVASPQYETSEDGNTYKHDKNGKRIPTGEVITALSDMELNAIGQRFIGNKTGVFKPIQVVKYKPTAAEVAANPALDNTDPFFVATYEITLEGGATQRETAVVRPNEFLNGMIKINQGENSSGNEGNLLESINPRIVELSGDNTDPNKGLSRIINQRTKRLRAPGQPSRTVPQKPTKQVSVQLLKDADLAIP